MDSELLLGSRAVTGLAIVARPPYKMNAMNKLRAILLAEREALVTAFRPLENEIRALRGELYEKQVELKELAANIEKIDLAVRAMDDADNRPTITIMEAVLNVLRERGEAMTANEILAEINERYFGGKIIRSSLSPQLSRLKDRDGKIDLKGNKWVLLPEEPKLPFDRRI